MAVLHAAAGGAETLLSDDDALAEEARLTYAIEASADPDRRDAGGPARPGRRVLRGAGDLSPAPRPRPGLEPRPAGGRAHRRLTAEAAVERVRSRAPRPPGPGSRLRYLRERLHDLEDLERPAAAPPARATSTPCASCPTTPSWIARNLGPADLLEYDRTKLKGILRGGGQRRQPRRASSLRALDIPCVGRLAESARPWSAKATWWSSTPRPRKPGCGRVRTWSRR
ncbi:hypothetical protein ACRAWD_01110 [Caulobacter segnis]